MRIPRLGALAWTVLGQDHERSQHSWRHLVQEWIDSRRHLDQAEAADRLVIGFYDDPL